MLQLIRCEVYDGSVDNRSSSSGSPAAAKAAPPSGTNVTGTVQLRSPLENREKVVPPSVGEGFESSRWA